MQTGGNRSILGAVRAEFRVGHIPDAHILAMLLQMSSGGVAAVVSVIQADLRHPLATAAVAVVAIVLGVGIGVFPWHRFAPTATRWIIPEALALVVAFNVAAGAPLLYSIFYLVIWAWIGLTQAPGVGLRYAPLLVAAYLAPIVVHQGGPILVSALCVVPICIVIAETVAAVAAQLRSNQTELERAAYTDGLTGLGNRVQLHRHLLAQSGRGGLPDALFLDLDGFKVVNDSLGHPVGDRLLRSVTDRLSRIVGDAGLYRVGGDEFVVLARSDAATSIERLASAVVVAFGQDFELDGRNLSVGVSVGVAHGARATGVDDLLQRADLAMYRAKQAGGRRWELFDDALARRAKQRLEVENDLRVALRSDQFVLEYQPLVELATGRVVGAEALVRWDHATMGRVGPDTFIPIAEESGLIVELGDWVLNEALRQNRRWDDLGHLLTMSVNVSPVQLRSPSFVGMVAAALRRSGVPADRLHIEITEGTLVDPEVSYGALQSLRELGVGLDIDDFGTGYSSLSYLQRLDVDTLKIDRSFLSPVGAGDSAPIVGAIVAMAHNLGLAVVAEGVETPEQLALLRRLGADFAQGFLFARPLPANEVTALLAEPPRAAPDDGTRQLRAVPSAVGY